MQKQRLKIPGIALAGSLALYAAIGFLVLPPALIWLAHDMVRADYGRELSVGAVRVNPFTLVLEVERVSLPDADGGPLLAFERLRVDLQLVSLWRRAFSFRAIAVDGLAVTAVIRRGGALNLADLVPPSDAARASPADEALPRLFIDDLAVTDGTVHLEDRDRPTPFVAKVAPLNIHLENFSTVVTEGERYEIDAGLLGSGRVNWRGTLTARPFASVGEFRFTDLPLPRIASYFADALPVDVTGGVASVRGKYRASELDDGINFVVDGAEFSAASLAVRPRGAAVDYVAIDGIAAKNIGFSLADQQADIGEVSMAGARVNAWLDTTGELNLAALAGPVNDTGTTPAPAAAPAPDNTSGWRLRVPRIVVTELALAFEDRGVEPIPAIAIKPLNLTVEGYSSEPETTVKAALDAVVNEAGKVAVAASINLDTFATEAGIELGGIELAFIQPYVAQQASLELTSGALSAKGQLSYGGSAADSPFEFKGDVGISKLTTVDNALGEDFVKWDDLQLQGLEYRSRPERLRIRAIEAKAPYARVIIGPDGTTNLAAILAGPGAVVAGAEGPTLATPDAGEDSAVTVTNPEATPTAGVQFPVRIGVVRISGGSARFADFTTRPNFSIGLNKLVGTVEGLSSESASRATVALDGKVGEFSPVTIRGEVNPLAAESYLDMAMNLRNVELASFAPYSGRFAGYKIRKGKFSADLNYKVEERKLVADHDFVIDQLELGDKVDSPDAVSLPLKLAVALLKDRNGTINLDLPVAGDLDDPEFSVGPIVWKVFVNLLTKAVTAPFALLGNLFGGGEEINRIGFAAGDTQLDAAGQGKIRSLAKALAERPGLKLTVPAVFSRSGDAPALQERAVQRRLVKARKAELAAKKQPADAVDYASIAADPETHLRLLAAAYAKTNQRDSTRAARLPDDLDAPARLRWYEERLTEVVAIGDTELYTLARERAEGVQAALLTDTGIDPGRVFLLAPADVEVSEAGVLMELALQ